MLIIETDSISLNLIEKRIFHLFVKDFCFATYSDMVEVYGTISDYCQKSCNNKYGMLLIELGHGANSDKDARAFPATKEANIYTRGAAILVENAAQQLLGEYYIRFNRPIYTNKVFYEKPEALKWIRERLTYFDAKSNN